MKYLGKFEVMWTLYFTVIGLIWMVFEKQMGWHDVNIKDHAHFTNFFGIVATLMVVLFMKAKRQQLQENSNYKALLYSGIAWSIGIAILTPLSLYITFEFITPDFFINMIRFSVENKLATLEEAQDYFNFGNYVMQSTIFALIMGIITSTIVAIFFRKPLLNK